MTARALLHGCMILLALSLVSIPSAAQETESFTCQTESAGSKPTRFYVSGGRLYADMQTRSGRPPDYGPATVSATSIRASQSQPLMTDGTGRAETRFEVDKVSGRFEMEVFASRPGAPPLQNLTQGTCHGFSLPANGGNADIAGVNEREEATREKDIERDSDAREEAERAAADRAAAAQVEREKAARDQEEKRRQDAEKARLAKEEAARRAMQERLNAEKRLRAEFRGHATTCPGGGKDVLYLQTSAPAKTGCNVRFMARCGVAFNTAVWVKQANYVGGSCMGVGDLIQLGQMSCSAEEVVVEMTEASCR